MFVPVACETSYFKRIKPDKLKILKSFSQFNWRTSAWKPSYFSNCSFKIGSVKWQIIYNYKRSRKDKAQKNCTKNSYKRVICESTFKKGNVLRKIVTKGDGLDVLSIMYLLCVVPLL